MADTSAPSAGASEPSPAVSPAITTEGGVASTVGAVRRCMSKENVVKLARAACVLAKVAGFPVPAAAADAIITILEYFVCKNGIEVSGALVSGAVFVLCVLFWSVSGECVSVSVRVGPRLASWLRGPSFCNVMCTVGGGRERSIVTDGRRRRLYSSASRVVVAA
jgi:hypothetical protein